METNENPTQSRKVVIIVIIVILLAANGVLLWQFFTQKQEITTVTNQKNTIIIERDDLQRQKAALQAQFDSMVVLNGELNGKLKISDDSLQVLQAKINSLQFVAGQYAASKAQLDKLKAEMATKMEELAVLQKDNEALKADKNALTSSLKDAKTKNDQITQDRDMLAGKVALGSIMRADNIKITGAKFNKSGKESSTEKAKNVQKLKIAFTVDENLVVDKGNKTIYIRVIGPDNKCIEAGNQTFQSGGQQLPYTVSQDINYSNQKVDQIVYWSKGSAYKPGKYSVEFYIDGNLVGKGGAITFK
ncbi:MAG: hypothetical protein WCL14_02200 [Bacteroidota bacterium]